jgi:hypothetical protein
MNLLMKSVDCAGKELNIKDFNHFEVNKYLRQAVLPKATNVQEGKFISVSFKRKSKDASPRIISPLQAWKNSSATPLDPDVTPTFDLRAYTSSSRTGEYMPERSSRDSQITLDMMIKHPTISPTISLTIAKPGESEDKLLR